MTFPSAVNHQAHKVGCLYAAIAQAPSLPSNSNRSITTPLERNVSLNEMTTPPSLQRIFNGAAGAIEAFIDVPTPPAPYGIAVITHPHPLQGGSALHKVPQALARCFQHNGWLAVRPNFRGIGASDGAHDMGFGETDDVLAIVRALRADYPGIPLALAGFSFGAFVQARAASILNDLTSPPTHTILAGTPYGTIQGERRYETPDVPKETLVIHGGSDTVVPLANVMQWATPQRLPIVVLPGANHFLTGYLDTVIRLVNNRVLTRRLASAEGSA